VVGSGESAGKGGHHMEGASMPLRTLTVCLYLLASASVAGCQYVSFANPERTGGGACDASELTPAGVSVSTEHLRFHYQLVGTTSVERTITVTADTEAVIVDRLEIELDEFTVEPDVSLPMRLAPGDSLDIRVAFTPVAAGALPLDWSSEPDTNASLAIHVRGCAAPAMVRVSGTGHVLAGEGVMNVAPLEIVFGAQPVGEESPRRSIFMWNGSDQPIHIIDVWVPEERINWATPFSSPTLDEAITLAPGTGREFFITFTPSEVGDVEGSLWCETSATMDDGTSLIAISAYPLLGTGI